MKTTAAVACALMLFLLLPPTIETARAQDAKGGSERAKSLGADLDQYLSGMREAQKFVALGACIFTGDSVVWDGAYGYADLEGRKLLRRDDILQIASLSKTVTATALMQLYERGLFKLDDDINGSLPFSVRNPNFPETPITFRMLLTHTSSLEDVLSNGLKVPKGVPYPRGVNGDPTLPLSTLVEELFTPGGKYYSAEYFSSTNAPGTKYSYSNFAFSLIGYLVEKIAKQDFAAYCTEHIFLPLGMRDTAWKLKGLDTSRVVFAYGFATNDSIPDYKKVQHFGEPGYPAGNLRTTMRDFASFVGAFINRGSHHGVQLLKPETVALMTSPQGVKEIPSRSFPIVDIGLTWLINDVDGTQLFSMNGFSGAIFTAAYFSPKEGVGMMFFYTGIRMKSMPAMIDIAKKLHRAAQDIET